MFVPCIIRRSRNNQHYALIFTTPLFYILAPTCFSSSLPSSGSFLDPSELLEMQIEWVVFYKEAKKSLHPTKLTTCYLHVLTMCCVQCTMERSVHIH
jgi:hypothetical protein